MCTIGKHLETHPEEHVDSMIPSTCMYLDRTCMYLDRTCMYLDRTCMYLDRTCMYLDRACMYLDRTCMYLDRMWMYLNVLSEYPVSNLMIYGFNTKKRNDRSNLLRVNNRQNSEQDNMIVDGKLYMPCYHVYYVYVYVYRPNYILCILRIRDFLSEQKNLLHI